MKFKYYMELIESLQVGHIDVIKQYKKGNNYFIEFNSNDIIYVFNAIKDNKLNWYSFMFYKLDDYQLNRALLAKRLSVFSIDIAIT